MLKYYVAIALGLIVWIGTAWIHHDGVQEGIAKAEAKYAKAAATAQAEQDRRATASATATTSMLDYLAANLPPIETTTHEAIQRVRIVYRDHPVPGVCVWDSRVRDELEAARIRANTAGGRMPAPHPAASPAHP